MVTKSLLVTDSTGWQGGAVISALIEASESPSSVHIFAVVSDIKSSKALDLAKKSNITILEGSLKTAHSIFARTGAIDSLFCLPIAGEEYEAKTFLDISLAHGVKHFVLGSIDRGAYEDIPTGVRPMDALNEVELYLKERAQGRVMTWTVLRRTVFMDDIGTDFTGRVFGSLWASLATKRIQVVSLKDIGRFAAAALLEPESWSGKTVGMAGDELSFDEAEECFKDIIGKDMPQTYSFVGSSLKWGIKDLRDTFQWLAAHGHKVDIDVCQKQLPGLQDFRTWLIENRRRLGQSNDLQVSAPITSSS